MFFGGGAGGGKSWEICESRLVRALRYPGYKSFIGREELKRLMQSTFQTWVKVCKYHKVSESLWKLNGQYNYIEFTNGSRIDLLDLKFLPHDPLYERFGSLEYTDAGAIEEAGEVHFLAYDVLRSRGGRHLNREFNIHASMLVTGNPKKNWTHRVFYQPFKAGSLPKNFAFIQSLYQDNPFTADDYGKQLAQISDRVLRQRLKDGNWDYDEEQGSLTSHDALSDAFSNTIVKDDEKYLVLDVARKGKDNTCSGDWDGLELTHIELVNKQDTSVTIQRTKDRTVANQVPRSHVMADEDGIGGAVVDGMPGIKGFVANSTPLPTRTEIVSKLTRLTTEFVPKTNFANLKSQCAFKLAQLLNERKIRFNVPEYREIIIEELTALLKHKDVGTDGKLQIRPKDEVKQELGRSPDVGDMIIMRMWFELKKDAFQDADHALSQAQQQNNFQRKRANIKSNSNE